MASKSNAPVTSQDFGKAYRAPITFWRDVRVPKELKDLVETCKIKIRL
jgi:hypothetical protein